VETLIDVPDVHQPFLSITRNQREFKVHEE